MEISFLIRKIRFIFALQTKKDMAKKAKLKLYGDVTEWGVNNAEGFIRNLQEANRGAERIALHVHSYGGSVLEGNMLYNAIKNNPVPVDCHVDGIAASMAAIVLTAADKVYMAENAFLMLHAPAGRTTGRGTAEEHVKVANLLSEIEKTFVKALASRTGKDEEYVKKWLSGENWLSASQALEEGLIDGITTPVAKDVKTLSVAEAKGLTASGVYSAFNAHLINNQTDIEMNKKEVIEKFGLTGVTEASSEAEILATLETKFRTEREAKEKAERDLKAHNDAAIGALLDEVKGRITAEQVAQYKLIGERAGIPALQAALQPYRQKASITAMLGNTGNPGGTATMAARASWTFDEWMEKDPAGLEALAKIDYETFNALYRGRFGVDAPR